MKILLVEDDILIGDGLHIGLERMGFTVDWFKDGPDGKEALLQAPYDAVVLDIGLPNQDGLSILKEWRNGGRVEPVLILTAKGDVDHRVIGLDSGADDYLAKPFALSEVAARLKALIRRHHNELTPEIKYKDLTLNLNTRVIKLKGEPVALSPKELMLLELFLFNKNKILTRASLEEKMYSWDNDVQSNAIEVHIHHIRRKFGKNIIKTINKIGYILGDE